MTSPFPSSSAFLDSSAIHDDDSNFRVAGSGKVTMFFDGSSELELSDWAYSNGWEAEIIKEGADGYGYHRATVILRNDALNQELTVLPETCVIYEAGLYSLDREQFVAHDIAENSDFHG